ncbi:MAG TPA: hypothetical protein VLF89_09025 [Candidatus Saccharimonadales bacterium]|nr:hypothetical protein [Candidatus Saccharimonadales bacterium]
MAEQSIPHDRVTRPLPEQALQAVNAWNDRGYRVERYGESPSVVILGESHFNEDERAKQRELLRMIRPEYMLHELGFGSMYNPKIGKYQRQPNRTFDEFGYVEEVKPSVGDELIAEADALGFTIIGCDLTNTEVGNVYPRVAALYPDQYIYDGSLRKIGNPTWKPTRQSEVIVPFREEFMVDMIHQYQQRSPKAIVAVMGRDHSDNIQTRGLLQSKGFDYVYVDQVR